MILIALLLGIFAYAYEGTKINIDDETQSTTATPVSGKVIVVDAGHGVPDEGAQSSRGTTEAETNLKISLKILLNSSLLIHFALQGIDKDKTPASVKQHDVTFLKNLSNVLHS